MRPYLLRALRVAALAGPLIALASAYADQWSVEKAGFNLYRITGHGMPAGQDMFVRTEGCDDAPAAGVVDIRKDGATRRLMRMLEAPAATSLDAEATWYRSNPAIGARFG